MNGCLKTRQSCVNILYFNNLNIQVKPDIEVGESQVKASFESKDEENNEEAKALNPERNLLEICDRQIDQRETSIEKG